MCDCQETVIAEYANDCRIVHEERNYPDLYHVEGANGRMKSFKNPPEARLYADIYTLAGGFNEEQTGQRGVPPTIVRASEDLRITYIAVQMSITYAAEAFDLDESVVRDTVDHIHARAEGLRS